MSILRSRSFLIPLLVSLILLEACAPISTPTNLPLTASATAMSTSTTAATMAQSATASNPTAVSPVATGTVSAGSGSIQYVLVPAKSEASYAVREQLAKLNLPSDAVGKTKSVAGSISLNPDGTIDSAHSKITVELSTLQTDQSMRDNFVSRNVLQTSQYPQAIFVPTQINGLSVPIPQSGSVTFKVIGDLTIRNVTKPVTWDVTGSIANGEATGTATTSFTFEDFSLTQPQVPVVLSVVDKITLNVTVDFKLAGS